MLLGGYEVMLDKYKLKTPMGRVFRVHSEALAVAVATEWDSQDQFIKKPTMYLVAATVYLLIRCHLLAVLLQHDVITKRGAC